MAAGQSTRSHRQTEQDGPLERIQLGLALSAGKLTANAGRLLRVGGGTSLPGIVARRASFRQEHLRLATEAHERGELLLAGALADPADRALLIFYAEDQSVAERFAQNDPYVRQGLVKTWTVRPWTVSKSNECLAKIGRNSEKTSGESKPMRVFTVNLIFTASRNAPKMASTRSGSRSRPPPAHLR